MKKVFCAVVLLSLLMTMFCTSVYAVGCAHENSLYDSTREIYPYYTDCGDYHEMVEWYPRICIDCGEQFWQEDKYVYVEGHNLALTDYDRVHSPRHAYTFTCLDCRHVIIIFVECDGPPCEVIYLPAMIDGGIRE